MLYKCVCMYSCTAGGPCYINVYVCVLICLTPLSSYNYMFMCVNVHVIII